MVNLQFTEKEVIEYLEYMGYEIIDEEYLVKEKYPKIQNVAFKFDERVGEIKRVFRREMVMKLLGIDKDFESSLYEE